MPALLDPDVSPPPAFPLALLGWVSFLAHASLEGARLDLPLPLHTLGLRGILQHLAQPDERKYNSEKAHGAKATAGGGWGLRGGHRNPGFFSLFCPWLTR